MSNSKTCSKCKQEKPLDQFYKNSKYKTKFSSYCKQCHKSYSSNYQKSLNPEQRLKKQASQKAYLEKNPSYNQDYYIANKDKIRETQAQWIAKNKEKKKAWDRAYVKQNRSQVRQNHAKWRKNNKSKLAVYRLQRRAGLNSKYLVTAKEIEKLLNGNCFYCEAKATEIDHVLPLILGGVHSIGNLVGACKSCNTSKGGKLLIRWRIMQMDINL